MEATKTKGEFQKVTCQAPMSYFYGLLCRFRRYVTPVINLPRAMGDVTVRSLLIYKLFGLHPTYEIFQKGLSTELTFGDF